MQEEIIAPVPTELIEAELTPDRFLRFSNKGNNHIYVTDAHESPNVMKEIGRLREQAFRAAGGGTGKSCDIDEFDTMPVPCKQLIVWDPDSRIILGGYRFIFGPDMTMNADGMPNIATSHMFRFSPRFIKEYLPNTLELGRSFVRVEYQSSRVGAKAIFALDNLWDGLGALTVRNPGIKYLFGKMTMYPTYSRDSRNMILYFLKKHFPDPDRLVYPITPLDTHADEKAMAALFTGETFKDDYRILNNAVRAHGVNIPPLVNAYMSLSPTMHVLGTAINDTFGDVEETGIFLAIDEIFEEKKRRHIETYTLG
ncbi:MAG: GNAT family N-acetyltransferase, partial [Muribaculaceae bacterium]|nr:GNAT family N-acetyltransferase [Muribaculaceae bacterium]